MRSSSKDQSLNPAFPWALTAVIGQMAQSFVIGLPRVGNQTLIIITEWLETCQYIEKMVLLVSYQFEPESDDETVEVSRTFLSGEGQVCGVIRWDKTNVLLQHVRDDVNHMEIVLCFTLWTGKLCARTWVDIMQISYFVTYSRNRKRFEFLTTRLGDCKPTLFWQTITLFIVHCRLHNFADSLCSHTATWHMKGDIRKGIMGHFKHLVGRYFLKDIPVENLFLTRESL